MMSFRVSPKAERDLQEIGDYIAFDNPTRALSFIQEIEKRFTEIAQHPELYRRRDEIFFWNSCNITWEVYDFLHYRR